MPAFSDPPLPSEASAQAGPAPPYHTKMRCDKEGSFLKLFNTQKFLFHGN